MGCGDIATDVRAVKQLNVELRLAAKKAKEEARAQQTDRRAQEAEGPSTCSPDGSFSHRAGAR